MELNKIASVSDEAKGSASPSPNNNSSGTRSKLKTKAANSYGQFLKHRRLELKQADPHAKLNRSEVSKEWRSMGSEAKKVFVERYRKEKELIGPIDRKASKVKVDALKKVKQIKNPKKGKVKVNPTINFLNNLESIDQKITAVSSVNAALVGELAGQKQDYAVNKYKLKAVTEEVEVLKDKFAQLVVQHESCKISND